MLYLKFADHADHVSVIHFVCRKCLLDLHSKQPWCRAMSVGFYLIQTYNSRDLYPTTTHNRSVDRKNSESTLRTVAIMIASSSPIRIVLTRMFVCTLHFEYTCFDLKQNEFNSWHMWRDKVAYMWRYDHHYIYIYSLPEIIHGIFHI